jgi:hypothetical protein
MQSMHERLPEQILLAGLSLRQIFMVLGERLDVSLGASSVTRFISP